MATNAFQAERELIDLLHEKLPGWAIELSPQSNGPAADIIASNRDFGDVVIELKTGKGPLELFHLAQLVAARNEWAHRVGRDPQTIRAALLTTRQVPSQLKERARTFDIDVVSNSRVTDLSDALVRIVEGRSALGR